MSGLEGLFDARRVVVEMVGADVRDVLQGVVTNDVDAIAPDRAVYAALLTPQGKYLFDFFLLDGGPDTVLIDVARDRAAALAQRLGMYCMRRDAKVTRALSLQVGLAWGDGPPQMATATVVPDPRDEALGWRIYADNVGSVLDGAGVDLVDTAEHDALRVRLGIPEGGIELLPEETFILEAGFERLHGVDFRKGCYVGQEVTARMKHKTELRKGLVKVAVSGAAEPGTPITSDGKSAGTLFTVSNGTGLAHLRLDRAGPGMQAGDAVVSYTP
jgi:folate-binding protein YgfZ